MPSPVSVLVADGSRDCADAVAMLLVESGMRTAVACDAPAALSLVMGEAFDAAVMDIALPGAGGPAFAEEVRRLRGPSIRLVAYTAWPESVARGCGALAAFDEVVEKGSDPLELLHAVSAESYGALLRAMQASADHLRLELTLAENLLDTARIAGDRRGTLRPLIRKRLLFVECASSRLVLSEVREEIGARLERLRARLAHLG